MTWIKSVFGIFSPDLKSGFFTCFSPFFIYIVTAMCMKKRKNQVKNPSFQLHAKNPEHALSSQIVLLHKKSIDMSTESKTGKGIQRETVLLIALAVVGLVGLAALQFARKNAAKPKEKSLIQAEMQQKSTDAQTSAPLQRIPGELLRTSEYPEAGKPFKFYMIKSSNGPKYELDFGDGSPRKTFKDGSVTHTFKNHGPCMVTLYATYEGEEVRLDTLQKVVARVKIDAPVAPIIDY